MAETEVLKKFEEFEFLSVFGCPALAHIPKEKRRKLDGKSIECVMMGYSSESKAYRLFNPKDNGIIISRDVVFFEGRKVSPIACNDFYYLDLLKYYDDINSGESSNVVEFIPEIESNNENRVLTEDE